MDGIEKYAVKLVSGGAEDHAEDDLNENDELDRVSHRQACELGVRMARVIDSNPEAFLAWYRSIAPTVFA